jgi:hypothetical protein
VGKKSWARDVLTAAQKLPFHSPILDFSTATVQSVEAYRKLIEDSALKWFQQEVDSSDKLYLLHGRREPQKDKPAAQKTLIFDITCSWSRRIVCTPSYEGFRYIRFHAVELTFNFCVG